MNLAWTRPNGNTRLQDRISYEKVRNMAMDIFCYTSKATSDESSAPVVAASAECDEAEKKR